MATQKKLEKIPGFSQGVRVNAAARMVKLARPICPNSKLKMVRDDTGRWVPSDNQPVNCQMSDEPEWWKMCAELGHDPYFTNKVWYEPQDKVEVDEDGNEVVVGTIRIKHVNRYPNLAQVAAHVRVNSGRGAIFKMERHGFIRLTDLGFEDVCQFRNCQKPIAIDGGSYGKYCGKEHLQLICADAEGIMLHYPSVTLNAAEYQKVQKARDRQLREAGTYADV